MKNKKIGVFKTIIAIIAVTIIIGAIILLFPLMENLSTMEGQIEFKAMIDGMGFWGFAALFGLQVAQIFLIIVPGEPIEILAGMCYGALWGTVFIMVSACIISTGIYLLVRKYGVKFVNEFCNKEKVEKVSNSKLFKNPKKIEMIMLILFFIPGTPKDLICYIAGLLPIKPINFILISTFARFPSVISSTAAGGSLALGNWKMAILMYAIIFAIVTVAILIFKHFDKDKVIDESIKTIK